MPEAHHDGPNPLIPPAQAGPPVAPYPPPPGRTAPPGTAGAVVRLLPLATATGLPGRHRPEPGPLHPPAAPEPGGFSPFVSYAEGFEPITGQDRHGKTFEPTASQQWEAGVKYQSADRRHQGTLSAFHITKQNEPTRDPNGSPYNKTQAGEVLAKGLELEANSYLTDNRSLAASLTLLDMAFSKDDSGELLGKTPVWVPERQASLWANYDVFEGALAGATLGAGVRHAGKTHMDSLNTDQVPAYTLVDLALGYDLGYLNANLGRRPGATVRQQPVR
ncbi:TonB-dependent siderophore receptor [Zobellella endophytica]|uniref:TonB-dependent siderophore receptor n=1 Tax=Zobellella endophytica TaxID=2116700 RepID=UPI001304C51A|nr:TonB-dependent receptor [Zobellella endophytica]